MSRPRYKRPGSKAKYPDTTSALSSAHTPSVLKPAKLFTYDEIKEEMEKAGVLAQFESLPPFSAMMFHMQEVNEKGGEWKLHVGNIIVDGEKMPLWAHMTKPCQVEWRYDINSVPTLQQRPNFELVKPFHYLYAGAKVAKKKTLDTTVALYFVASGKWPGMIEGGDGKVSIRAMAVACLFIAKGLTDPVPHPDLPEYIKAVDATSRETFLQEECIAKEKQLAEYLARTKAKEKQLKDCLQRAIELIEITAHFGGIAKDLMNKTMTQGSIGRWRPRMTWT